MNQRMAAVSGRLKRCRRLTKNNERHDAPAKIFRKAGQTVSVSSFEIFIAQKSRADPDKIHVQLPHPADYRCDLNPSKTE